MTDDMIWMSVAELTGGYRRGDFTPVEAAQTVFARIAAVNGKLNAFQALDEDRAMTAAQASGERWRRGEPLSPIDGAPVSIKDLFDMTGLPTRRGSTTTSAAPALRDAPAIARLRAAGAVITGKTTTPEFGWKGVTDSPLAGITRNPWNLEKTPGGSSGGASAACAAGMGPLHLGTDGGGSIRIPAALSGIFGLKPQFGRVPYSPPSPMGTLAHVGPMTRTVGDALLMLNVLMGDDLADWFLTPSPEIAADTVTGGVAGLRIAFSPRLGYAEVDAGVAALVKAAAETLAGLGAEIIEADPGLPDPAAMFNILWQSGAYGALRRMSDGDKAALDPGLQKVLAVAEGISLGDYMDAQRERAEYGAAMKSFMAGYDALITPSLATPGFGAGRLVPEGRDENEANGWIAWTPFTYPFNLTQQPACSVPCGFTEAGLPVGLQIVAPMFDDACALRIASAFEAAQPVAASRHPTL